jgi:nucleoside transporter
MRNLRTRLSAMMFVEFFIWGAWAVTLGTYLGRTLGFTGQQIGLIYGTTAIAAIISPLFVGFVADRHFASERVFSALHFAGAVLLYLASEVTEFAGLYVLLLAYSVCYMPTLAVANGIGFRHLPDPDRQFPLIRVLGTIGWIVAGLVVGYLGVEDRNVPLKIAAGMSLLLAAYGFMLPHTPPKPSQGRQTIGRMLGFDAFSLLRDKSFLVLFVSSVLISIPLAFYYNFTNLYLNELGVANAAGKMTMGQASEVIFMILMPFLFRRMGVKWMIAVGMLAWTVRYVLFAYGDIDPATIWTLYAGIILHGICYDFFFVAGQIYANGKAPESFKNSVQAMMTLGTYGIGMFIGSLVSGWIVSSFTSAEGVKDWETIWLIPASMALVVLVLFVFTFRDDYKISVTRNPVVKPKIEAL